MKASKRRLLVSMMVFVLVVMVVVVTVNVVTRPKRLLSLTLLAREQHGFARGENRKA